MKKTTYALIAMVGLFFAGIFVIVLLLRFNQSSNDYRVKPALIAGEPKEHRLEPFTSIRMENSEDLHRFYINGERDYDPSFVHIVLSDSAASPAITISDGWDGILKYYVKDSTLIVIFLDGNRDIEPSDITIVAPGVASLYFASDFPAEIESGTVDTLKVEFYNSLSLGKLKAGQVIATETNDTYSGSTVNADEAEIGYLELNNIRDVDLFCNNGVNNVCVSANESVNCCDISLTGTISGTIRTHADVPDQEFSLSTRGDNTFSITK